jgi:hypothetical protein
MLLRLVVSSHCSAEIWANKPVSSLIYCSFDPLIAAIGYYDYFSTCSFSAIFIEIFLLANVVTNEPDKFRTSCAFDKY